MTYPTLGALTVVPVADLQNLASAANLHGDTRKGGESLGKTLGRKVLTEVSTGVYAAVFALGDESSAAWQVVDGSLQYTPVNVDPAAAGFTIGGDSTYADNLLTTDGGDDIDGRVFQTVALKAGSYRLELTMACEGELANHDAPRLRITSGTVTAGVGATEVVPAVIGDPAFIHETAAEDTETKQTKTVDFTLASDLSVTFTLDNVDEAGALQAGSSYIALSKLESIHA